jgi:hypothetical protein
MKLIGVMNGWMDGWMRGDNWIRVNDMRQDTIPAVCNFVYGTDKKNPKIDIESRAYKFNGRCGLSASGLVLLLGNFGSYTWGK